MGAAARSSSSPPPGRVASRICVRTASSSSRCSSTSNAPTTSNSATNGSARASRWSSGTAGSRRDAIASAARDGSPPGELDAGCARADVPRDVPRAASDLEEVPARAGSRRRAPSRISYGGPEPEVRRPRARRSLDEARVERAVRLGGVNERKPFAHGSGPRRSEGQRQPRRERLLCMRGSASRRRASSPPRPRARAEVTSGHRRARSRTGRPRTAEPTAGGQAAPVDGVAVGHRVLRLPDRTAPNMRRAGSRGDDRRWARAWSGVRVPLVPGATTSSEHRGRDPPRRPARRSPACASSLVAGGAVAALDARVRSRGRVRPPALLAVAHRGVAHEPVRPRPALRRRACPRALRAHARPLPDRGDGHPVCTGRTRASGPRFTDGKAAEVALVEVDPAERNLGLSLACSRAARTYASDDARFRSSGIFVNIGRLPYAALRLPRDGAYGFEAPPCCCISGSTKSRRAPLPADPARSEPDECHRHAREQHNQRE